MFAVYTRFKFFERERQIASREGASKFSKENCFDIVRSYPLLLIGAQPQTLSGGRESGYKTFGENYLIDILTKPTLSDIKVSM